MIDKAVKRTVEVRVTLTTDPRNEPFGRYLVSIYETTDGRDNFYRNTVTNTPATFFADANERFQRAGIEATLVNQTSEELS